MQPVLARETPKEAWTGVLLPVALILGLALLLSLNMARSAEESAVASRLDVWLKPLAGYLAVGAEIAAALVVGIAAVRGLAAYLVGLFKNVDPLSGSIESIRLRLGRVLALGLEFTIASDILRTAVAPTRQDIMNLGAMVLLRTLLNHFLEREIRQGERLREAA